MKLGISKASIQRPIPPLMLMLIIVVIGIFSYLRLPVNAEPNISFPMLTITVNQSGASPEEIERAVTIPVEDAIASVADIRHISSSISEGESVTTLEFNLETDINKALNAVKNAISEIRASLPKTIDEPTIEVGDTEGGAIAYYAVESTELNETELSSFIDDSIVKELLTLEGVQKVKRLGGRNREIRVEINAEKLNAYKTGIEEISSQIKNISQNTPA
jgi:multidrug efflux pump subunit AcrB